MKKIILSLICCFVIVLTTKAQTLFGTTSYGGADHGGTISKFIASTNNLTVAKSFESIAANPFYENLIQASDGKMYGMTAFGGSGYGVIFSYDPSSGTYSKLKDFDYLEIVPATEEHEKW